MRRASQILSIIATQRTVNQQLFSVVNKDSIIFDTHRSTNIIRVICNEKKKKTQIFKLKCHHKVSVLRTMLNQCYHRNNKVTEFSFRFVQNYFNLRNLNINWHEIRNESNWNNAKTIPNQIAILKNSNRISKCKKTKSQYTDTYTVCSSTRRLYSTNTTYMRVRCRKNIMVFKTKSDQFQLAFPANGIHAVNASSKYMSNKKKCKFFFSSNKRCF